MFRSLNYIRKKEPPSYTTFELEKAIAAITSSYKMYKQVSEEFGIPASVIFNNERLKKSNIIFC